MELLLRSAGYVGIAIENANLYQALQRKVDEYERLKEFSENIVESINVGILAADLDDRVESWNSQMEELTGISREQARWAGRCPSCFRRALWSSWMRCGTRRGIHHIDKFVLRPMLAAHATVTACMRTATATVQRRARSDGQHRDRAAGFARSWSTSAGW